MQSNHEAFINLSKKVSLAHMYQHGNNWKEYQKDSKFYCAIEPEVFEVIQSYGGVTPNMIIYPMLLQVYTQDNEIFDKIFLFPIFCVRKVNDVKLFKFFDVTGKMYSDTADFLENQKFPAGKIAFPKDFHYEKDEENEEILVEWCNIDTEIKLDDMELKSNHYWIDFMATAGLSIAAIFALTCSGALPAFGVILGGGSMFYGTRDKCDPLDDPLLKEGEDSLKLFETYGVLVPKHYKISTGTEMPNLDIQRNILIMAGHHISAENNDVKTNELFVAINKEYGTVESKWQIFCCDELYSYDIHPKFKHFFNANISTYDFVIFVPGIELPEIFNNEPFNEIKQRYEIKEYSKLQKNKSLDKMMEDIALRLCTNHLQPKDIVRSMKDIFGGNWNCFLSTGYHSYQFTFNGFISLNSNEKSYCLFY